ncbi:MAG: system, lactose/cellobiose-specific family, component [Clostridiales bacterium]|jgi:PTS system cellobiose-specific IIB component|nr:system, lactose/cellobiose-specific family, component [Clostridiales bacterium]
MKRITLICAAGMSTSLLVTKMNAAAIKQGAMVKIIAIGEAELKNYWGETDVFLLGPQVRYLLNRVKAEGEEKGIPVELINSIDYGLMNGEKVLNQALNLLKDK